jgi:inner membrane protein YidH
MIQHYSDHAANERTFLAWIRTAIAIMAFGFLVQKFDLFLQFAAQSFAARSSVGHAAPFGGHLFGTIAGLALIVLGGAMMVMAVIRFHQTSTAIAAEELRQGPGARPDIVLVALLLLLGLILFVYLIYSVSFRV